MTWILCRSPCPSRAFSRRLGRCAGPPSQHVGCRIRRDVPVERSKFGRVKLRTHVPTSGPFAIWPRQSELTWRPGPPRPLDSPSLPAVTRKRRAEPVVHGKRRCWPPPRGSVEAAGALAPSPTPADRWCRTGRRAAPGRRSRVPAHLRNTMRKYLRRSGVGPARQHRQAWSYCEAWTR